VRGFNAFGAGQVGDGAGDLENPVVGAGGQVELLHRLLQQVAERRVEVTMLLDLGLGHAGVGLHRGRVKTGALHGAGSFDARANGGG